MFFSLFLLDDGRIRIGTSDKRIREAQILRIRIRNGPNCRVPVPILTVQLPESKQRVVVHTVRSYSRLPGNFWVTEVQQEQNCRYQ